MACSSDFKPFEGSERGYINEALVSVESRQISVDFVQKYG